MEGRSTSRWSKIFVLDWNDRAVQELKLDPRGRHVKALRLKRQPPRNISAILQDVEPPTTQPPTPPTRPEPFICPPSQLPPFPPLPEFTRPNLPLFTGILVAGPPRQDAAGDSDPFAKK
jgi:hypothetical protein